MISPSPLSLFCALLLCLPFAVLFTITTPAITSSAVTASSSRRSLENPLTATLFSQKSHPSKSTRRSINLRTINSILSPPPPLPPVAAEDDESLLRLAAKVNVRPRNPKKIAFMFLTTSPLFFAPIWELYFNGASNRRLFNIYVHADPSYTYAPPFSGVFAGRVIRSEAAQRFTPSLASAARRILAHALLDDRSNAMFALLSPSCIPLHSFDYTYRALARSRRSFIEILKDEEWAYDRWAARGEDAMLPEVKLEDFRIGSQFWALTRKHARLVVGDRRIWTKFNLTCVKEDACYPEENYFSTLVHMWDPRGAVSATLTHVDWRDSFDGHPRMYNATDVGPELIEALRSERPRYGYDGINGSDLSVTRRRDSFLFARKFSPESLEPLLSIAEEAILKD